LINFNKIFENSKENNPNLKLNANYPEFKEDIYKCVKCGFCLTACPTYLDTGLETESPRGRIALMRAVTEERLPLTNRIIDHWALCLQCRACEAVCPSGVPFGHMMESTRNAVNISGKQGLTTKLVGLIFLRFLLKNLGILRFLFKILYITQILKLHKLFQWKIVSSLLPKQLSNTLGNPPIINRRFFTTTSKTIKPNTPYPKKKVVLLAGCIMPLTHSETLHACVEVLKINGCEVMIPEQQGCCGALNIHNGELKSGKEMAKKNIESFLESKPDAIISASAGCGSTMKEYHQLLKEDPKLLDQATLFSKLTKDITEFLIELPLIKPKGKLNKKVIFQNPCHLLHAQNIYEEPKKILDLIPGLDIIESIDENCCGAAGIYSILQQSTSQRILEKKLANLLKESPDLILTANPGCMIQIEQGLKSKASNTQILHIIELLYQSYITEIS